tara:strand:- start:78 stop:506 length:429 start_codon:yes stop_codon:yes gene_type:complete
VFVEVINHFVCLAETFFGILEMEVAAPRKDDVVALVDFEHVSVKPVNEILHFLLGVEGAKCGIVVYEVISCVEVRSKTVAITEDGGQNLLLISEVFLVWPPEEVVGLVGLPDHGFAFIMASYKQSFETQICEESGVGARVTI